MLYDPFLWMEGGATTEMETLLYAASVPVVNHGKPLLVVQEGRRYRPTRAARVRTFCGGLWRNVKNTKTPLRSLSRAFRKFDTVTPGRNGTSVRVRAGFELAGGIGSASVVSV